MFHFIHGFTETTWDAQIKSGLFGEHDGIRFPQNILLKEEDKFNQRAAKGSKFHQFVAEHKCPMYIDRLQGGVYIDDYCYDEALLEEYRNLLGDNFWGFQMHEWLSNYRGDLGKLTDLPDAEWTTEGIIQAINKKFPYPCLFLEAMTAEEMAAAGNPKNAMDFCRNMGGIYQKRQRQYRDLIPCDSYMLAYPFEIKNHAKRLMPEIGKQTPDTKVQIVYARSMALAHGITFGAYYEPWGGQPFSACCYQKDNKNEWGIGESADFPFVTAGPNGGSSRSLQRRMYLYAFLSGAEFISEEWGICNTFVDWNDFELSDYGKVNLEFLNFARKYRDVGAKLAPIAAILPADLEVLEEIRKPNTFCTFPVEGDFQKKLAAMKEGVCKIFSAPTKMLGTEFKNLINSEMPDAVDLFNDCGEAALKRYDYLVDLTGDPVFSATHRNCCQIEEIPQLLHKLLPCYVDGNVHWMVNECTSGGYYLTVFNHSGINRTVEEGEYGLPEATEVAALSFKKETVPALLEGDATLQRGEDGIYHLSIPAGGWAFLRF